tara:strand:+ start:743 stop:901 length:159 start_codon:yes stop_codon:yes gene_type:complete
MKVKLIKDYKGIGRKKGDMVDCNQGEFDSMVERGYVADPNAKPKAKNDGASG